MDAADRFAVRARCRGAKKVSTVPASLQDLRPPTRGAFLMPSVRCSSVMRFVAAVVKKLSVGIRTTQCPSLTPTWKGGCPSAATMFLCSIGVQIQRDVHRVEPLGCLVPT